MVSLNKKLMKVWMTAGISTDSYTDASRVFKYSGNQLETDSKPDIALPGNGFSEMTVKGGNSLR